MTSPSWWEMFLAESATNNREKQKTIADDAMLVLKKYPWPGNVRELKNLIERLVIMVQQDTITARDLPANLLDAKSTGGELFSIETIDQARMAFESEYVRKKLVVNDNDIDQTAKAIGVSPAYIASLVKGGQGESD